MPKTTMIVGIILLCLVIFYLAGTAPSKAMLDTQLPEIEEDLTQIEAFIRHKEAKEPLLKPAAEARIVWANEHLKQKTAYSVLYLHGFSATQAEGDPIHLDFARRYGCNLYLARLHDHGLNKKDAFRNTTPDALLETAKEAVAIAKKLGDKLIIISTSTGGTLSLYLAAHHPDIEALILYSPNIDLYAPSTFFLDKPWGEQIAKIVIGSEYTDFTPDSDGHAQIATLRYHVRGLVHLKSLISATMNEETFKAVKQPVFLGYYYKNEDQQDKVVSVKKMLEMYEQLGSSKKRKHAFENTENHVIASKYLSKDIESVRRETFLFAEEVLGLKAIE